MNWTTVLADMQAAEALLWTRYSASYGDDLNVWPDTVFNQYLADFEALGRFHVAYIRELIEAELQTMRDHAQP